MSSSVKKSLILGAAAASVILAGCSSYGSNYGGSRYSGYGIGSSYYNSGAYLGTGRNAYAPPRYNYGGRHSDGWRGNSAGQWRRH